MTLEKNSINKKNFIYRVSAALIAIAIGICSVPVTAKADTPDYAAEAAERKLLPIQSNDIPGWPEGPEIPAQAAILLEANTGTILYAKNIHEELYPASTTKIMTCLLAVENASLDDKITFSNDAVFSVPHDGSSIGMDVGESITLEQALYGIMVGSANEVANAVGEHVSGSIDAFVDLMNDRAAELGCTNTHFNNTNGLQDNNHYTSAYDLAMIARAFFANEFLCKVGNTPRYHFTPTSTQPDDFYLNNKHKLITGEMSYEGILGGKTGYTGQARETLVTCAEKNGMRLICVVLKDESPAQFSDTVTLFDYGFNNFRPVNIADNDDRYMPDDSLFFESEHDVFGSSGTILNIRKNDKIILPKTSDIKDTTYEISYDLTDAQKAEAPYALAKVSYSFNNAPVGEALICYFGKTKAASTEAAVATRTIYINIKLVIIAAFALILLATIIQLIISQIIYNHTHARRNDRIRFNRRKKETNGLTFKGKKF